MIQVKKSNGEFSVISTVSDLTGSMCYCEHKIPFLIRGTKRPPTDATMKGSKAHQRQELNEKEHFKMKPIIQEEIDDIRKDIEFPYETINTRLIFSLTLPRKAKVNLMIYGRADKIYRIQQTLTVEESKYPLDKNRYFNTNEPFPDQKLQALLYLNSAFSNNTVTNSKTWFSIPHTKKAWVINIKDRNSGETIKAFRGLQTNDLEEYMKSNLAKFASIAIGELQPRHHESRAKCQRCGIQSCQHNLCFN